MNNDEYRTTGLEDMNMEMNRNELMIVTHHKIANDYSGKEKRHADF